MKTDSVLILSEKILKLRRELALAEKELVEFLGDTISDQDRGRSHTLGGRVSGSVPSMILNELQAGPLSVRALRKLVPTADPRYLNICLCRMAKAGVLLRKEWGIYDIYH